MYESTASAADNRSLKRQLRASLRRLRRSLTPQDRTAANRRICANIRALPAYRHAQRVATFLAFDGEPSLDDLRLRRRATTKRFCVPVIRARRMRFAPTGPGSRLRSNSFGIREPRHRQRIPTRQLDIVLVSLVGFDATGNRLGMGGGYYDRHFSFLKARKCYFRPRLIGVAYAMQELPELPRDPWDVPMWGIVTDRGFRRT